MIATRKAEDEHQDSVRYAWHSAAFLSAAFAGKLPSLQTVLTKMMPLPRPEELQQQIASVMGGLGIKTEPASDDVLRALVRMRES